LKDKKFDPEKIRVQAKKLRESHFKKPKDFNSLMESIEKYPEHYSDSYKEYEFAPELRFGK